MRAFRNVVELIWGSTHVDGLNRICPVALSWQWVSKELTLVCVCELVLGGGNMGLQAMKPRMRTKTILNRKNEKCFDRKEK